MFLPFSATIVVLRPLTSSVNDALQPVANPVGLLSSVLLGPDDCYKAKVVFSLAVFCFTLGMGIFQLCLLSS